MICKGMEYFILFGFRLVKDVASIWDDDRVKSKRNISANDSNFVFQVILF